MEEKAAFGGRSIGVKSQYLRGIPVSANNIEPQKEGFSSWLCRRL
ncbi:MAG: hypothetical protein ACOYIS_01930 [Candidatus Cloacimonadaceae bacterium]